MKVARPMRDLARRVRKLEGARNDLQEQVKLLKQRLDRLDGGSRKRNSGD